MAVLVQVREQHMQTLVTRTYQVALLMVAVMEMVEVIIVGAVMVVSVVTKIVVT